MSDLRPEITAKADGQKIVVRFFAPNDPHAYWDIPLSPQECFALQCQLSAAYQAVAGRQVVTNVVNGHLMPLGVLTPVKDKPETWRDREPMF